MGWRHTGQRFVVPEGWIAHGVRLEVEPTSSPVRALTTSIAPVRVGITHCKAVSRRWARLTSVGVSANGLVPPSTGTLVAFSSPLPSSRA
jgi:hypothetical protein